MHRFPTRRLFKASLAPILLTTLLFLSACSNGGGPGDGGGGTPTEPQPGVLFVPDRGPVGPTITFRDGGGDINTLRLEVFASEIEDLQGVEFGFTVPTELLRLDTVEQGDFLSGALLTIDGSSGTQTIFDTRVQPGGDTGSGVILTLVFTAIAPGNGRIDFLDPAAFDSTDLEMMQVDWIGGEVRITN